MSIQEIFSNFKRFGKKGDTALMLLMVSLSAGSFWLGYLTGGGSNVPAHDVTMVTREMGSVIQTQEPVSIENAPSTTGIGETKEEATATSATEGAYVASKNGTKYHLPWCGSAKQIKEENKVWFTTKEEAEAAGYTPASNCKGI